MVMMIMISLIGLIFVMGVSLAWNCEKTQFVCYYGSWSKYRSGIAKFEVKDIDPDVCTHVIYSFVGLDESTGKTTYLDPYLDLSDDWHRGALDMLADLKARNPNLKTMIAVGGWNEGSEKYSKVCADPVKSQNFVNSYIDMLETHKLDGLDLDWEYPAQRGGAASDRECFSRLLRLFRAEQARRGLKNMILSCAVSANKISIPQSYECGEVSKQVDFINVMAYDLHGSWEDKANHHTALDSHPCENPAENYLNIKSAIQAWIDNGADPCKLNLGLGSYGRSFQLNAATPTCQVCAPARGPYPAGEEVGEDGFLSYREICRKIKEKNWRVCYSQEQSSPYVSQDLLWVGYDDPASVSLKAQWAKNKGLGGVMLWSIETDDNVGVCGQGKFPLCNAIRNTWFSNGVSPPPLQTTTRAPETTTTTRASDTTTTWAPETTTTTQAPETTSGPTTTENPNPTGTTPNITDSTTVSNPSERCASGAQYYRDPQNCSYFYLCENGPKDYQSWKFTCPPPTVFDETINTCNHKENVPECNV